MEREKIVDHIRPIKKLYIAQRGEIAFRAAKACLKRGIPAVVPYTFSDANPLATQIAEAHLDKGWGLSAPGGTSQDENYANPQIMLDEIKLHGCDGVFLGYGFLAENADFVKMCEDEGIKVLAPPSEVMRKTGNKIRAREFAKKVRIGRLAHTPVIEGTQDLKSYEQAIRSVQGLVEGLNFPVMLKDPDLGGGAGNRVATNEKELEAAYKELKGRAGNKELFMERYIENGVHVEVQIVADQYGNVVSLGERDCSLQRKGQKIVEESPSPNISPRLRRILQETAVRLAKGVKYEGAGTWEFLIDLDREGREGDPAWYFMEVNPRIQVEHPVTEEQTGIDIIDVMLDIAEGKPLSFTQKDIKPQGHTIEARVYAENPDRNFETDSGAVSVLKYPDVGVRIDPALREGDELSPWYDHTVLKAVSHAETRELAREKLIRLLAGSEIIGVSSNLHFLTELLNSEEFREGKATTTFVERWWKQRMRDKVHDIDEFIAGGVFNKEKSINQYNPGLFPKTSTVISRKDGTEESYQDHVAKLQREKGTTCAAEYGIQERDGVKWVLYRLDYSINAGALGPEEGNRFVAACKMAYEQGLDLVTLISTGGADQWTNTLALHQMTRTMAALKKRYPPKSHITVYHGPAFGGVPASFGDAADFIIMVDSLDSRKGFSGIFLLAKNAGITIPEGLKASDIYKFLAEADDRFKGAHSAVRHLQERGIDYRADDLRDASDKITHLIHATATEANITDVTRVYEPKEKIELRQGSSEATRFDRPGTWGSVWFSPISRLRERMVQRRSRRELSSEPLTNDERWKILYEIDRPTAADLLDTKLPLFDDTVLLTGPIASFGKDEYYQSVIAAVARIKDIRMLVLAHQPQMVRDELTGKLIKRYNPQKPEDWEIVERFIQGIGLKNRLPILTITDTEGADPSLEAEARRQSGKIQRIIDLRFQYPFTSLSFILGPKGSGGGETFSSPADGAAAGENIIASVADPRPKSWIQGGKWLDEKSDEFKRFINGETTARAEVLKDMKLIDVVIDEGPGGAHRNTRLFAKNIRAWLLAELQRDMLLSIDERAERRWQRNEAPSELFNTPEYNGRIDFG